MEAQMKKSLIISISLGFLAAALFGASLKIDEELHKAESAIKTTKAIKPIIEIAQAIPQKGHEILKKALEPGEFKLVSFATNLVKKIARKIKPIRKLTERVQQVTEDIKTAPAKKKRAEQVSLILKLCSLLLLLISLYYLTRYLKLPRKNKK